MSKSQKPLERPDAANFSSEAEYNNAYQTYLNSFDTSAVEDFSDLNIEFKANGKRIETPSMLNFSDDITEMLKNSVVNEGLAADPSEVTVTLHAAGEPVGAKVSYNGKSEDMNITWTTQEEDYERMLPDGNTVKSFSPDYYDMEKFTNLENIAKQEFAAGLDDIPSPDQSDGLGK